MSGELRVESRSRWVRGQSNVIGVILLLGLVVTGATVVIYAGTMALTEEQQSVSFSAAEQSMEKLSADISSVSNGRSTTRADMSGLRDGQMKMNESAGRVNITIRNLSTGNTDSVRTELGVIRYEQGERALVYQSGSLFELAGGGAAVVSPAPVGFRTQGATGSLTIPIITVRGNDVDDSVTLERTNVTTLMDDLDGIPESGADPDPNDPTKPLPPGSELTINITSEYYEAWGRILEERINVSNAWISYDHERETVTVTIRAPYDTESLTPVFLSYGTAVGSESAETDSYDSSVAPYSTPGAHNGDFWVKGIFKPSNSLTIGGDLRAEDGAGTIKNTVTVHGTTAIGDNPNGNLSFEGGNSYFYDTLSVDDVFKAKQGSTVTVDGDLIADNDTYIKKGDVTVTKNVYVDGNATLGKFVDIDGDLLVDGNLTFVGKTAVGGTIYTSDQDIEGSPKGSPTIVQNETKTENRMHDPLSSEVRRLPSATSEIDLYRDLVYEGANHNGKTAAITRNSLTSCPCTLTAGRYALDSIDQPGAVEFDTTDGDITLYVHEGIDLGSGDELEVTGPNEVRIYVGGGHGADPVLNVDGRASVRVDNNDSATQLWVYTKPDDTVQLQRNSVFQGVLYGAGGRAVGDNSPDEGTTFIIENKVHIYGAIIGDIGNVGNNVWLHYDEALAGEEVFGRGFDGGRVRYVHVTARNVSIDT